QLQLLPDRQPHAQRDVRKDARRIRTTAAVRSGFRPLPAAYRERFAAGSGVCAARRHPQLADQFGSHRSRAQGIDQQLSSEPRLEVGRSRCLVRRRQHHILRSARRFAEPGPGLRVDLRGKRSRPADFQRRSERSAVCWAIYPVQQRSLLLRAEARRPERRLGARNDQFTNYDASGVPYIRETKPQWAPRLGFSWDVHGDSTLKVFGNAGRYYLALPDNVALSIAAPVINAGQ